MKSLMTKLFRRTPTRRPIRNVETRARLRLESMEERVVMDFGGTGGVGPPPMNQIVLNGTESGDVVEIDQVNGQYRVVGLDGVIDFGGGNVVPLYRYYPTTVARIVIYLHGGGDGFRNDTGVATTVYGGPGNDWLIGGTGGDMFYGEAGDDRLEGRGGADTLDGGLNNDSLEGGSGNDSLVGGAGNDNYAYKGYSLGQDTITEAAYADADTLDLSQLPGSGVTVDLASTVTQTVWSYIGSELDLRFSSHAGLEDVRGTAYADTILGNNRSNVILGNGGADTLYGRFGSDRLEGGAGMDWLYGDADHDVLYGHYMGAPTANDADFLSGGSGSDDLHGGGGNDTLHGGTEADDLYGGDGQDSLYGNDGVDVLHGGTGDDRLEGGPGIDTMDGEAGYDRLLADRAENLSNGEYVKIQIIGGSPQDDDWSCGPNSGSRFLDAYGVTVSYADLRSQAEQSNIISEFHFGTPPPELQGLLQQYKPDVQLESGASFEKVLQLLGSGKPVIALIGSGTVPLFNPAVPFAPLGFRPTRLHYVVLNGFDLASQTLFYSNTNGAEMSLTFADFQDQWDWTSEEWVETWLDGIGVTQNTILY